METEPWEGSLPERRKEGGAGRAASASEHAGPSGRGGGGSTAGAAQRLRQRRDRLCETGRRPSWEEAETWRTVVAC